MILSAHQPVYLPWLGLFHKIAISDRFVSFNQVQYLPKDWNNRNRIKTANGPVWLTVPVHRKGYRDKKLADIEINNDLPWQRKHWRTLQAAYARAPYFEDYAGYFEGVYTRFWPTLATLDESMLAWFVETLGIEVELLDAADYAFEGRKSDLVLDMCKKLGASTYVFGTLGRDYADLDAFERSGIEVVFQEYDHPRYPQLHGPFVSHLSIVDLLFNCGPDSLGIVMSGQRLIRRDGELVHP